MDFLKETVIKCSESSLSKLNISKTKKVRKIVELDCDKYNLEGISVAIALLAKKHNVNIDDIELEDSGFQVSFGAMGNKTDAEIKKETEDRFERGLWYPLYDILMKNGYKRVGFNSILFNEFKDTTVYEMFTNNEHDRLARYYSFRFSKIENKAQ